MNLKEFVKEILSDITNAVKESQTELDNGCIISPNNTNGGSMVIKSSEQGDLMVSLIEFDVAVTTSEDDIITGDIKGGMGIIPIAVASKLSSNTKQSNENISRVKFSIPIVYPSSDVKKKPHQKPPVRPYRGD